MGYVYLICDTSTDSFKIGVTKQKDIEDRMKKLQTGNSTELFISSYYQTEYPFRLEKLLHNHFANQRLIGEWFSLTGKDVGSFRQICERLENIVIALKDNPFIHMT